MLAVDANESLNVGSRLKNLAIVKRVWTVSCFDALGAGA